MFIEEIDYGDAKSVPVPSLSALPAASSVPASPPPNELPSTSSPDEPSSTSSPDVPPPTPAPNPVPFRAPAKNDNRGAAPPRPRLLNLDDFFIIKASTERKLVDFRCSNF